MQERGVFYNPQQTLERVKTKELALTRIDDKELKFPRRDADEKPERKRDPEQKRGLAINAENDGVYRGGTTRGGDRRSAGFQRA